MLNRVSETVREGNQSEVQGGGIMIQARAYKTGESRVTSHILVMEDDPSVARGLEAVLSEEGYTVDLAETGRLALAAFERGRFDLLVADIRLPDMDGMEIIRQVRESTPDTEVIAITGYATTSLAVDAMKLGVHDFLPKPFNDKQIVSAVKGALQARGQTSRPATGRARTEAQRLIQKNEVIEVLDRTADDLDFWRDLMENGSLALEGYTLSDEAKAAIASGDLLWIRRQVGELTRRQLMFIYKRLEKEAW
jgi:CheY-like chemotaxis protein